MNRQNGRRLQGGVPGRRNIVAAEGVPPGLQGGVPGRRNIVAAEGVPPGLQGGVPGRRNIVAAERVPPGLQGRVPGRRNIVAAEGVPPVAPVRPRVNRELQEWEMEPYKCNHCKELVRGGVITICGHLFCWVCLWPLLHNKLPHPECPHCHYALVLHEDIVPFYGEGPNARPEDANVLAEPGAVPRPAGICVRNRNRRRQAVPVPLPLPVHVPLPVPVPEPEPEPEREEVQEVDDGLQIALNVLNHILDPPPAAGVLCPQIDTVLIWLKWVQVVCAGLIGLLLLFVSLT